MKKQLENEIKVGVFVAVGVALMCIAILMLGNTEGTFTKQVRYKTMFQKLEGVIPGAKVVLGGVNVGVVKSVDLKGDRGEIEMYFTIPAKYQQYVRADSYIELANQGLLGDKYVVVRPGSPSAEVMAPDSEIPNHPAQSLSEVFSKSDQLMTSLNSIALSLDHILKSFDLENQRNGGIFRNLSVTSKNLSSASEKLATEVDGMNIKASTRSLANILEKINNGTGTLGALVNDPGLYEDAKALMGGANRNRVIRNLVRKTVKDGTEKEEPETPKK